ncbi:hypothetical protein Tco_0533060 [Tanacetum coccineum]
MIIEIRAFLCEFHSPTFNVLHSDSDPVADPEEDDDEDPKEDPNFVLELVYLEFGRGGDCGSSRPGPTTYGDPISDNPLNGLETAV